MLHIDKHILSAAFSRPTPPAPSPLQPAVPLLRLRPSFTLASTGATSKQCAPANPHPSFPRPPHLQTSTAHSADPSPFVTTYLCITHLFLIISPLIFQFSLLRRPPSLHPFSSASLKAFHLSTISVPATPLSPRNLQPPTPSTAIRLNSYLPLLYSFISSLPILLLYLFRLATSRIRPSVCPLSSLLPLPPAPSAAPLHRLTRPSPAEMKPRRRETGPGNVSHQGSATWASQKQTLNSKIKYIKTTKGPAAPWPSVYFRISFHIFTPSRHPAPPSLSAFLSHRLPHSPPPPPFFFPQTDIVAVLTARQVCSD